MISEGINIQMGNLGRDWESKVVNSQGAEKTIWTNSLAVKTGKDETTWVDLTVWPDDQVGDAPGQAVAAESGRGTKVMVRGKFATDPYVSKDGESKMGWKCSVYQVGSVIRCGDVSVGSASNVVAAFPGAQSVPAGHEPF